MVVPYKGLLSRDLELVLVDSPAGAHVGVSKEHWKTLDGVQLEVKTELVPEDAPLQIVFAVNSLLKTLVLLLFPVVADHGLLKPSE